MALGAATNQNNYTPLLLDRVRRSLTTLSHRTYSNARGDYMGVLQALRLLQWVVS